jgi:enolase-phosphatase E1
VSQGQIRAVVLDIEGTTTPIDFVHKTLFGYARVRCGEFLRRHWDDPVVRADVARLEAEHAAEPPDPSLSDWGNDPAAVTAYVHWLMDRDRKSTGLKSLQGRIWEAGYESGELRGEVYPDVGPALERWQRGGVDVAIFSSGSVQAQQSLFRSTQVGDLTRFLRSYFDTRTGPKSASASYTQIAAALGHRPAQVLFVSDVAGELDAARKAGMTTALCVRPPGNPPTSSEHPVIRSFDELFEDSA